MKGQVWKRDLHFAIDLPGDSSVYFALLLFVSPFFNSLWNQGKRCPESNPSLFVKHEDSMSLSVVFYLLSRVTLLK